MHNIIIPFCLKLYSYLTLYDPPLREDLSISIWFSSHTLHLSLLDRDPYSLSLSLILLSLLLPITGYHG